MAADRAETNDPDLLAFARRIVRSEQPFTVIVVELQSIFVLHQNARLHSMQGLLLRELADTRRGTHFPLSNGDVVMVFAQSDSRPHAEIAEEIVEMVLHAPNSVDESMRRRVRVFALPRERAEFREWLARAIPAATNPGQEASTGVALDGQEYGQPPVAIAGPLTSDLFDRIAQRMSRADIRPFIRSQMVCGRGPGGGAAWRPMVEDMNVGVAELTTSLFPQLVVDEGDVYFGQLCALMDERLIYHLIARRYRLDRPTNLNLSMTTLFDPLFESFSAGMPEDARAAIAIELDCREILWDAGRLDAAIARLREAGLGVVVGGLHLEFLPYLRAGRFACDYLKVKLPRSGSGKLFTSARLKALKALPREKVVLTGCDTQAALDVGRTLGITLYQGPIVDAQAGIP